MIDKKGTVEIDVPEELGDEGFRAWGSRVWKSAEEHGDKVKFSFKVGLAVLLVSLLALIRAPYDVFGTNIIWSILTVAVMFEYTVGATFNRGFNRALGSLLAGILAIGVIQLALWAGRVAEPILIGFSIFLIGAITSFMKLWPSLMPYEYGFRVALFTFSLIIVSAYREGNPIQIAMDRLYSIAIGGIVAVLVNALVFPIWAGEQLHEELVHSFNAVVESLEECVKKYLEDGGLDNTEFCKTITDELPGDPAYTKCKTMLNSPTKLESLASSAKWEPPHGRFKDFFYPWSAYVKVGAVLRYCAYEVMALHGVLHSEIQAPYELRKTFKSEIQDATSQAAELVRSLANDISNMKTGLKNSQLKRLHSSTKRLQTAIDIHSKLLTAQLLHPSNSSKEAEIYHKKLRKQLRRLYSWPSREVEEHVGVKAGHSPRMAEFETTATLSLATFATLLIEFVARLYHLAEAVDELSRSAKFKEGAA